MTPCKAVFLHKHARCPPQAHLESNRLVSRLLQHAGAGLHAGIAPKLQEGLLRLGSGAPILWQESRING